MVITGVGFRREGNKIVMGQHMTSGVRATFYLLIFTASSEEGTLVPILQIRELRLKDIH